MYDVAEKVAVITGGTRGIGLALAEHLLQQKSRVVINGRSTTDEARALQETHGADNVVIVEADVSVPAEAARLVAETEARFGRLDMLVHSAGGPAGGKVPGMETESWMQAFAIHVHPVFHLFQAAHPLLAKEGGAVLLVSSVAGIRGCPGTVAYQTVKGALIPMAKALAMDHGVEGIRVNVIAPGIIRTRFHDAMTKEAQAHNLQNRIPLRREGSVDDVAEAMMTLLQNEFITGETLVVDGGMSMRVTG
ncbi:SDR family NAD(P)-dependent oxidoreductase [Oceaniglobus indicus]|uniref:SDR family NAD(P)-dependent oxidoreductase n=1 Tax=Oceaniglobus indicus TaxID=2047749 RepID=UPI000C195CC6|nr:SDR family oxidoreductase [Oceaniglobus indicus]